MLRVFLWHENQMEGDARVIWIVLRMQSGTATLTDHRAMAPRPPEYPDLHHRGLCLAKAQLFGTITEAGYHTGTNITSSADIGLGNHTIAYKTNVTAIHEFTVSGTPGQILDLRTIITSGSDFGEPYKRCLLPDRHIRGWWPFSELLANAPAWDAGQMEEPANQYHISICEDGGHDQRVFAWRGKTLDEFSTADGNRGLFGVNARYRVRIYNTHNLTRYVAFNERARRTGHAYYGAALALEEDQIPTAGGVPPIKHDSPYEAVRIRTSDLAIGGNTPARQAVACTVRHATAGGATMPVDIRLVSSPTFAPVNGPDALGGAP